MLTSTSAPLAAAAFPGGATPRRLRACKIGTGRGVSVEFGGRNAQVDNGFSFLSQQPRIFLIAAAAPAPASRKGAASNFIDLCKTGFYEGVHFHRVIPGFMNQFGCPNAKDPKSSRAGTGGPKDGPFKNLKTGVTEKRSNGGNIKDENISRDTNAPGTLSMANTGGKNTGGSQFFMNVADNKNLDWFSPGQSKHPVFGKITSGMDIATKISKARTRNDNPIEPIKMKSITISGA